MIQSALEPTVAPNGWGQQTLAPTSYASLSHEEVLARVKIAGIAAATDSGDSGNKKQQSPLKLWKANSKKDGHYEGRTRDLGVSRMKAISTTL